MLIDVSRRPSRILFEECGSLVAIRTMATPGVDGHIRVDADVPQNPHPRSKSRVGAAELTRNIHLKAQVRQGTSQFLETILVAPTVNARSRWPNSAQLSRVGYYAISAYSDYLTQTQGHWRLNFIFEPGPKNTQLLTLLDETNGASLFTVQLAVALVSEDLVRRTTTPLQRFLSQPTGAATLWSVLTLDGDELV
jgi:hypothetical protein